MPREFEQHLYLIVGTNALFLLGSIDARAGKTERAIALLEEGAAQEYRGQGADGLLLLGDLYGLADRLADQKRAYQWAVERDPESVYARRARRKLRALP